jgi:hypothetical protein
MIVPCHTLWPGVPRHPKLWFLIFWNPSHCPTCPPQLPPCSCSSVLIRRPSLKMVPCHHSLRYKKWKVVLFDAFLSHWAKNCSIKFPHWVENCERYAFCPTGLPDCHGGWLAYLG